MKVDEESQIRTEDVRDRVSWWKIKSRNKIHVLKLDRLKGRDWALETEWKHKVPHKYDTKNVYHTSKMY